MAHVNLINPSPVSQQEKNLKREVSQALSGDSDKPIIDSVYKNLPSTHPLYIADDSAEPILITKSPKVGSNTKKHLYFNIEIV